MTDKQTEALKLALEALEGFKNPDLSSQDSFEQCELAIVAIREALAEQPAQQEPVAWYHAEDYKTHFTSIPSEDLIESGYWKPLYTSPPNVPAARASKPWVGLNLDDREKLRDKYEDWNYPSVLLSEVDNILREKNT